MELFVIQCTTCRARLKVHDLAVVGQIIECPKCRSFVAVTAPPNWQSPANSPSSAATLPTAAGSPPAPSGLPLAASGGSSHAAPDRPATAGPVAAVSGAAASNVPVARSATPPPLPKKSGSSASGISSSSFIKPIQSSGAPSAPRAAAVVGAWAPAANRPAAVAASAASEPPAEVVGSNRFGASVAAALVGRYRWWVVGSAVAIVAVASVAWVLGRSHGVTLPPDQPPVVSRADQPTPDDTERTPGGAERTPGAAEATPGKKPGQEQATTNPAPKPAKVSPAAVPAAPPAPESAGSDRPISAENSAGTTPQAAPSSSSSLSAKGDRSVDGVSAANVDPLMPEAYGTAGGKSPETSTQPAGTATPSAGASNTAPEDGLDEGKAFDPVKQARLMTHLQDGLPALEFTGVPLGQFVAFLSEFSTVPMVIDTQSLAAAGKSAKTRITVKLDDATVEEALKTALDKPGLAFHIEPGRLVITPRAAKSK